MFCLAAKSIFLLLSSVFFLTLLKSMNMLKVIFPSVFHSGASDQNTG